LQLSEISLKNSELQEQFKSVRVEKQQMEEQIKSYQLQLQEQLNQISAMDQKVKIYELQALKEKEANVVLNKKFQDVQNRFTDKKNDIDEVQLRIMKERNMNIKL